MVRNWSVVKSFDLQVALIISHRTTTSKFLFQKQHKNKNICVIQTYISNKSVANGWNVVCKPICAQINQSDSSQKDQKSPQSNNKHEHWTRSNCPNIDLLPSDPVFSISFVIVLSFIAIEHVLMRIINMRIASSKKNINKQNQNRNNNQKLTKKKTKKNR